MEAAVIPLALACEGEKYVYHFVLDVVEGDALPLAPDDEVEVVPAYLRVAPYGGQGAH